MNSARSRIMLAVVLVSMWAVASPRQASAVLGLDIVTGGSATVNSDFTIGWGFDLTQSITVDALGWWDEGGDGLGNDHEVGLWTSGGALLASTTVTNASTSVASGSGLGDWLFEDLGGSVLLGPGSYVIGGVIASGNPDAFQTFVVAIDLNSPLANINSGLFAFGSVLTFPNQQENTAFSLFGPNLQFNVVNAVPEPITATLGLMGLGVLGMVTRRRVA